MPRSGDQDDYVMVARDLGVGAAEVSSILTEDGDDAVTTGELRVPAAPSSTRPTLLKSVFLTEG